MTVDGGVAPVRKRLRTKQAGHAGKSSDAVTDLKPTVLGNFAVKERHEQYLVIRNALDSATLQKLDEFLKRKRPKAAKMKQEGGKDESDDERKARYADRDSRVTWIDAQVECTWLHKPLAQITREVGNAEWSLFKKDASGAPQCEFEKIQYAVYGEGQHFQAWHKDAFAEGHDLEDARQLTIVVMLTDRSQYKGGSFQAKFPSTNSEGKKVSKIKSLAFDRGDAIVFPAKELVHRVSPVKSGIRKTLVFWANDRMSCHYYNPNLAKTEEKA